MTLIVLASLPNHAAAVPFTLNYQGQILISSTPFDGIAQFKFVLTDGGTKTLWSHDLSSIDASQPATSLTLSVSRGLYAIRLGDTRVPNMAAIPAFVFTNDVIRLRVWFNDGANGFQQLTPDREIGSVAFALRAESARTVDAGAIGTTQLSAALAGQIAALTTQMTVLSNQLATANLGQLTATSTDPDDAALRANGYERFLQLRAPEWTNGPAGEPLPRYRHTGVWTGAEFLIAGGILPAGIQGDDGGRFHPGLNQWRDLSLLDAPAPRRGHSAVWTGSEMIVWGGHGFPDYRNDGGRFNPVTQVWRSLTTNGAPVGRELHRAVWTGSRMIIWGGRNADGYPAESGLYDPAANQWTALPTIGEPSPRLGFTMVWAGDRLIVWGGSEASGAVVKTGAQLTFTNGVPQGWSALTPSGAPSARTDHAAIWTGERMLVWGGRGAGLQGNGAAYDPATDTWENLSTTDAPTAREQHGAVWTGSEMLIVGGNEAGGSTATSFAYHPGTRRWRPLSPAGGPVSRGESTVIWTGTELLAFGGRQNGQIVGTLQRLDPSPAVYLYRKP